MTLSQTISLNNFEGPLDLLLHLIQKNEINIYDVQIQTITAQFLELLTSLVESRVDVGAEFLSTTATLLLLKSQKLLPKPILEVDGIEEDPRFTLIHHLLEYCRFKELAKQLLEKEERELAHYTRGAYQPVQEPKNDSSVLESLSLSQLEAVFRGILERQAAKVSSVIPDERWQLSDKITWISSELSLQKKLSFEQLFTLEKPKEELIVIFLAILELMKCDQVLVVNDGIISAHQ
jgi:segregation and condensation protein A